MKVLVFKSYEELSKAAADMVAKQVKEKTNSILGLATGSSPVGMYKELVKMYKNGEVDFSKVVSYNLDEYCGLGADSDQSYRYFMQENLFNETNFKETFVPNGLAKDFNVECERYEKMMESAGYVDLQVLGIGGNAHIGFNEPADHFALNTQLVNLTKETIDANARFFASASDVPTKAITMGIGTIFKSKKIILVASGKGKQEAIFATVKGKITPNAPSSILQLHPDVTILIDEDAAGLIK